MAQVNSRCLHDAMCDALNVEGTPLEKMVLMLNEKMDALHARMDEVYGHIDSLYKHINSARHVIPWAEATRCTKREPPLYIDEWGRRGWDVWRVTMPSEPDCPPSYEIQNKNVRGSLATSVMNQTKYDRSVRSGGIQNGIVCNAPIVRELLSAPPPSPASERQERPRGALRGPRPGG